MHRRACIALVAFAAVAAGEDTLADRWDHPVLETFDLKGMKPERVAEEIAKRRGLTLRLDPTKDEPIDFAVKDVGFFDALDRFAAAQGLHLYGVPTPEHSGFEGLGLMRPQRRIDATPVAYIGASRLSVQGLVAKTARVFTVEGPRVSGGLAGAWSDLENDRSLAIVFKWIVEPGLEDLILVRLKLEAQDDTGKSLKVQPSFLDPDVVSIQLPRRANGYFRVDLSPPPSEARAIRTLSGSLQIAIPVERSEIEFRPDEVGAAKQLGGCQVTPVKTEGTVTSFDFRGLPCREIPEPAPSYQIRTFAYGADGHALASHECGGTEKDGREIYWEKWDEPPARVVLQAITKVALRDASFVFRDVPLPERVAAANDAILHQWDAPRRQTFALKSMPANLVTLELRRRYGFEFDDSKVSGDLAFAAKDATLFEALDQLAAALGLYVTGTPAPGGTHGLALARSDIPLGPAIVAHLGPSRLSVESVSALAVRPCAPDPKPSTLAETLGHDSPDAAPRPRLRIQLRWIVEPGFEDVSLRGLTLGQIEDEKGAPIDGKADAHLPVAANRLFALDFAGPPPKAKAIRKLEGVARVSIPVERGEISFAAGDVGATRHLGLASITLQEIDGETVCFEMARTPAGTVEEDAPVIVAGRVQGMQNEPPVLAVTAYDEKGAVLDAVAQGYADVNDRYTYKLVCERPPARLVFQAITKLVTREMPFSFSDIPLPE